MNFLKQATKLAEVMANEINDNLEFYKDGLGENTEDFLRTVNGLFSIKLMRKLINNKDLVDEENEEIVELVETINAIFGKDEE